MNTTISSTISTADNSFNTLINNPSASSFDLIFELDRQLQIAQNHSSPLETLEQAYTFLDTFLTTHTDDVDTVFLKLVDFFIKCNCNYKRSFISNNVKYAKWLTLVKKNKLEAIRRICSLWDQSVLSDYESCLQILNFLSATSEIFFDQPASFGIFFEAFSSHGSVAFSIYERSLLEACSSHFQKLFDTLTNESNFLSNELDLDELVDFSKFVSLMISSVVDEIAISHEQVYKIQILTSIFTGNNTEKLANLPQKLKEIYSNLLIYL